MKKVFFKALETSKTKKIFIYVLMIYVLFVFSTYAKAGTAVNSIFFTIYTVFTGWYTKVICLGGLVFIGIKMITNRGDPQALKSLVPWAIAAVIIGGASIICGLFIDDFSTQVDSATKAQGLENLLDKI